MKREMREKENRGKPTVGEVEGPGCHTEIPPRVGGQLGTSSRETGGEVDEDEEELGELGAEHDVPPHPGILERGCQIVVVVG